MCACGWSVRKACRRRGPANIQAGSPRPASPNPTGQCRWVPGEAHQGSPAVGLRRRRPAWSPQPASALRTRRDPWPLLTPRTPGKGLRTCGGRRGVGSRAGLERAGPAIPELPFNVLLAYRMVSPLLPWRQHRSRDLGASMVCVVC